MEAHIANLVIHSYLLIFKGTFTLIRMIYLLKGYNVLLTNYTGTIG